jgi:secondary thiamine-phosphate synthase enzyme
MGFVTRFESLSIATGRTVSLVDITSDVANVVAESGVKEGTVTVLAKHSTVGVMLNEFEERFVSDARQWLQRVVPPAYPWLHNDIDFRAGPPG